MLPGELPGIFVAIEICSTLLEVISPTWQMMNSNGNSSCCAVWQTVVIMCKVIRYLRPFEEISVEDTKTFAQHSLSDCLQYHTIVDSVMEAVFGT